MARLTKVGAESYAAKLATEAKADGHKVVKGEMMRSLDKLIRAIGIALVPIGAALLYKQHWQLGVAMRGSVETTVGGADRYDPRGPVPADQRGLGRGHDAAGPPPGADSGHELH